MQLQNGRAAWQGLPARAAGRQRGRAALSTRLPSLLPSEPHLQQALPRQGLRLPARCSIPVKPSRVVLPLLARLDASLPPENQPAASRSASAAAACQAVTAFACFPRSFPFLDLSSASSTRRPRGWSLAGMLGFGVCSPVRLSPWALHPRRGPPRGKERGVHLGRPQNRPRNHPGCILGTTLVRLSLRWRS